MKYDKAYCQWAGCMKQFKRGKGEILGVFVTCSKECEKALVAKNADLIYNLWLEKYEQPSPPAVLLHNPIAFPVKP